MSAAPLAGATNGIDFRKNLRDNNQTSTTSIFVKTPSSPERDKPQSVSDLRKLFNKKPEDSPRVSLHSDSRSSAYSYKSAILKGKGGKKPHGSQLLPKDRHGEAKENIAKHTEILSKGSESFNI